jgi:hypothetical protein
MKTKSKISGRIIRSVVYAVFLSVTFIALQRLIRRMHGINPPARLAAMTEWRRVRVNPERSASPSA